MPRTKPARLALAAALAAGASIAPARADWVATGSFSYMDRVFDGAGFTGSQYPLPIREADVEVVDANLTGSKAILAAGATDQNGFFSIQVPDTKVRTVYVRVLTRSEQTSGLNIDVRTNTTTQAQKYAVATPSTSGHAPTVNVNFGGFVAEIGMGGEPFNLYDQMLRGVDYLAFLNGSRPGSTLHLATVWAPGNGITGSAYNIGSRMILMRDTGGYDDTVLLHEMGHYAVFSYSASSSPGGFHTFALCEIDVRLAFDEGFATWWGNSVLRFLGLPRSNIYTRTNGGPGPGNLVRTADLETDTLYLCSGGAGEVNVFSFLWDITDGPATTDTTPGVDDSHDALALPDAEVWGIMTGYVRNATSRSLEDFWDGWFLPPALNGLMPEMLDIAEPPAIEYFEDPFEPNDTIAQAVGLALNGLPAHATFFRDPEQDGSGSADVDYFVFSAPGGQEFAIETRNLSGGADTNLRLYGADGVSLLAVNNDRASGDRSSRIVWVPAQSGVFYAQVTQVATSAFYGSYDLLVSAAGVDSDGDGYDSLTDCNELNPAIHPDAVEVCDGVDQDCDGSIDEGFDADVDGFSVCMGDCDDIEPAVNPGISEIPGNGIDDNCDGIVDHLGGRYRTPRYEIPE